MEDLHLCLPLTFIPASDHKRLMIQENKPDSFLVLWMSVFSDLVKIGANIFPLSGTPGQSVQFGTVWPLEPTMQFLCKWSPACMQTHMQRELGSDLVAVMFFCSVCCPSPQHSYQSSYSAISIQLMHSSGYFPSKQLPVNCYSPYASAYHVLYHIVYVSPFTGTQ